ncbi:MAG: GNAT family N-acetyltransferase [Nocardioidaceae bacterium]
MVDVRLRPMTQHEYDAWWRGAIAEYAEDNVRTGSMPADSAQEMAAKQFAELLPDGLDTQGQHLLVAEDGGERVGVFWVHIRPGQEGTEAFIYDITVEEALRGRGYGRAAMVAGETFAREHGAKSVILHVFEDNTAARSLYQSLGYKTSIHMGKSLTDGA